MAPFSLATMIEVWVDGEEGVVSIACKGSDGLAWERRRAIAQRDRACRGSIRVNLMSIRVKWYFSLYLSTPLPTLQMAVKRDWSIEDFEIGKPLGKGLARSGAWTRILIFSKSFKTFSKMNIWDNKSAAWPIANPILTCASVTDSGFPIGDLHGDLAKARSALELAGVLSSDGLDTWTGHETVLVQLGDILDRGEDEIAILSRSQLLRALSEFCCCLGLFGVPVAVDVQKMVALCNQ
ncbi:hypothetical protein LXL04_022888 [Taraxacum kok-saghyz]